MRRLTKENGGVREPEVCLVDLVSRTKRSVGRPTQMRIPSSYFAMFFVPPSYVAYAWTVDKHVTIAGPIVALVSHPFHPIGDVLTKLDSGRAVCQRPFRAVGLLDHTLIPRRRESGESFHRHRKLLTSKFELGRSCGTSGFQLRMSWVRSLRRNRDRKTSHKCNGHRLARRLLTIFVEFAPI